MHASRRTFLSASVASTLVGGMALSRPARAAWDKGQTVTMPAFALLDGTTLDAAGLRGKLVVLEFWASWCPFCARQNPLIEALYREHKSRGLEVVAVSIDKTKKAAEDYIRKHGYTFKAGMINPAYEAIFRLRKGLPQTYVIARDGRVVQFDMGEMFDEDIKAIAQYL